MKERIYHVHNRACFRSLPNLNCQPALVKAHSKYVRWPVLLQIKETHFKVIIKFHPVSEILKADLNWLWNLALFLKLWNI